MKQFVISVDDGNQRLNKFLQKCVPLLPQGLMYKYIRIKRIKVNGQRSNPSYKLNAGDVIELYINDDFFKEINKDTSFLNIKDDIHTLYEDKNILLVNKKPGMIVHSDDKNQIDTLVNHIKAYLYRRREWDYKTDSSFTPALCNRIDRNTGGIVICAKNARALRIINQKIKDHEIKKQYLCLVHGSVLPINGTFSGYILKHSDENRVTVHKHQISKSKTAITHYEVLMCKDDVSLVRCTLVTGRTHQIRAHFSNSGHPLVGDTKYGKNCQNGNIKRKYQALYSYSLQFDFKTDSQELFYLNHKKIEINPQDIDFVRQFMENETNAF